MAYAIVKAWRWGTEQEPSHPNYGKPFCEAAYLPTQKNTVCLWLDKEQMQENGLPPRTFHPPLAACPPSNAMGQPRNGPFRLADTVDFRR